MADADRVIGALQNRLRASRTLAFASLLIFLQCLVKACSSCEGVTVAQAAETKCVPDVTLKVMWGFVFLCGPRGRSTWPGEFEPPHVINHGNIGAWE